MTNPKSIADQLRDMDAHDMPAFAGRLMVEAADEIEQLTKERDAARRSLELTQEQQRGAHEPAVSETDALDAARYRAFRKSSVRTWNLSFPNKPRTEADIDAEQDRWMAEDAARDPKYANSLFPATQKAKDDYFAAQAISEKSGVDEPYCTCPDDCPNHVAAS